MRMCDVGQQGPTGTLHKIGLAFGINISTVQMIIRHSLPLKRVNSQYLLTMSPVRYAWDAGFVQLLLEKNRISNFCFYCRSFFTTFFTPFIKHFCLALFYMDFFIHIFLYEVLIYPQKNFTLLLFKRLILNNCFNPAQ